VTEAVIMRTADGKPRGFGFVTFASELACDKACRSAAHELGGRTVRFMPRSACACPSRTHHGDGNWTTQCSAP
jgi:hypothetical protein